MNRLTALWIIGCLLLGDASGSDTPKGSDSLLQQRWRSAIANDDTRTLGNLFTAHPAAGLGRRSAYNGKTALMVAAKADDLPLVKTLVADGTDIQARTATGGTAMMFTALGESVDVARWLHAQGASLEDVGSNGWTALTIAAARGFESMVGWLLDAGAAPSPVDVYGFTPLMRSVANAHPTSAALLLDAVDIDIDHADEFGNTALHHAAFAARVDLIVMLLDAGADERLTNRAGQTAADLVVGDATLAGVFSGD